MLKQESFLKEILFLVCLATKYKYEVLILYMLPLYTLYLTFFIFFRIIKRKKIIKRKNRISLSAII